MFALHRIISAVGLAAFASMAPTSNAQLTYNGTCDLSASQISFSGFVYIQVLSMKLKELYPCKTVSADISGSASSFAVGKVCALSSRGAPVDIAGLSRKFSASEWTPDLDFPGQGQCKFPTANLRKVREIEVGNVALTVAVASTGPAKDCIDALGGLTVEQVKWIFSNSTTTPSTGVAANYNNPARAGPANSRFWSDLSSDPKCQATEIGLHGVQVGSTPQIQFSELVGLARNESLDATRGAFTSTDPTVVASGIAASPTGIGFLLYHASLDTSTSLYGVPIKLRMIDNTFASVPPTIGMIRSGSYPLRIPLFMYVHSSTVVNATDPSVTTIAPGFAQVRDFLQFVLTYYGNALTEGDGGYVPLDTQRRRVMLCRLDYTEYCGSMAPTNAPIVVTKAPTSAPFKAPTVAPVKAAVVPAPVSGLRPPTPAAAAPAPAPAQAPEEPAFPLLSGVFAPLANLFSNIPSLGELLCPPKFVQNLLNISC